MREFLNTTEGLRRLMQNYQRGYVLSISFITAEEKVAAKDFQWERDFGTRLLAYQRQDRKQRGQPTAVATSVPVPGNPSMRELFLMSTRFALDAHPDSPWAKERWSDRLPRCGDYILVHSPSKSGPYGWTWNLQESVLVRLAARLTRLVKAKDAFGVRTETYGWCDTFSMVRGVRGQLIYTIKSARKLWIACHQTPWPGISPEELPFISEFRRQQD